MRTTKPEHPSLPNRWPLGTTLGVRSDGTRRLHDLLDDLLGHMPGTSVDEVTWRFGQACTHKPTKLIATLMERSPASVGGRDRMAWSLAVDPPDSPVSGRLVVKGPVRAERDVLPGVLANTLGDGLDPAIRPGVTSDLIERVDQASTTIHAGGTPLLTTPAMILGMETAAAAAASAFVKPGYDMVGAHNDVAHLKPAFQGEVVEYNAVLIGISGRRLVYEVTARVGDRLVGTGRHESHVVRVGFGAPDS